MKKCFKKSNKIVSVNINTNDVINILASLDFVIFIFTENKDQLSEFHISELRDLAVLKDKILTLLD